MCHFYSIFILLAATAALKIVLTRKAQTIPYSYLLYSFYLRTPSKQKNPNPKFTSGEFDGLGFACLTVTTLRWCG
jgi:hypothetical protein